MELCNTWVQIVHFILRQFLRLFPNSVNNIYAICTDNLKEFIFCMKCYLSRCKDNRQNTDNRKYLIAKINKYLVTLSTKKFLSILKQSLPIILKNIFIASPKQISCTQHVNVWMYSLSHRSFSHSP